MFAFPLTSFAAWMPTAVGGFVIPIGVDAVKFIFAFGSFAHICEEIFERIPTFTNGDSSTPIIFKRRVVFKSTPDHHATPRAVSRGTPFSFCMAMDGSLAIKVASETAAAFGSSAKQIANSYIFDCSAGTATDPSRAPVSFSVWGSIYDKKSSESFSNTINGWWMGHASISDERGAN